LVKRKRIVPLVAALPGKSRPNACAAPETVTATERLVLPPLPLQVRVNVFDAAVSAPVPADPEVALEPLQAPLAVHELASLDDQVRDDEPPLATEVGLAESVTVGAGTVALTFTVAERDVLPPVPVQVSV
jgi:hypothetical protein